MADATDFDFWLGEWRGEWGEGLTCVNRVSRSLDDRVILEEFRSDPPEPLLGMSVSVYDERLELWRQTWVDSEGSYIDLVGAPAGDTAMTLEHAGTLDGEPAAYRMRFLDVTEAAFRWEWEVSRDGTAWEPRWTIAYRRI